MFAVKVVDPAQAHPHFWLALVHYVTEFFNCLSFSRSAILTGAKEMRYNYKCLKYVQIKKDFSGLSNVSKLISFVFFFYLIILFSLNEKKN